MKKIAVSLLLFLMITQMYGQKADSLLVSKKLSYKSFIIPAAFVASGALLLNSELNGDIQTKSGQIFGTGFRSSADDIFPFVPITQIYLGKSLGFAPKTNYRNQTVNIIVANTATVVVVEIAKRIAKRERPDLSDNMSFPSGHSAVAFTNATLLYYEYKDANFWYASSGFLFAGATAAFRIANNKHFASDVLVGAGIGTASGIIFSHLSPLKSFRVSKKSKTTAFVYPQLGSQIGLGAIINPDF
ncbi:phosphatase PAP2 family protein [Flavobacterium muglaense]|uniref:Phosphatase PAP2 family protein n=1 Tax=Flavobacterium muglaense TaxID=2764716 RepID=A0A923SFH4_9FLAO|nr:phosphatase PAP2 family protein [Flavobacterium muglaense]MBC5837973.1 phosphatase PAP2 family protein [Flavobacterium muglaense]MBC5844465.1 phosphatase PAP2 family protein [Flavobacterium muglaense]